MPSYRAGVSTTAVVSTQGVSTTAVVSTQGVRDLCQPAVVMSSAQRDTEVSRTASRVAKQCQNRKPSISKWLNIHPYDFHRCGKAYSPSALPHGEVLTRAKASEKAPCSFRNLQLGNSSSQLDTSNVDKSEATLQLSQSPRCRCRHSTPLPTAPREDARSHRSLEASCSCSQALCRSLPREP